MSITISATFTKNSGAPATGLTLAQINFYLTAVNKTTGVSTVIWDGTQNPTVEVSNAGSYIRIYTSDDLNTYDYYATAQYTGVTVLDAAWVNGIASSVGPEVWGNTTRTLTQSAAAVAAAVAGSTITILRGDSLSVSLTGLGALTGYTKLWFTVKASSSDADTAAIIQILLSAPAGVGDGLQYLNSAAAATKAQGSITVDDAVTGAITIALDEAASALLSPANSLVYDVQVLIGSAVTTKTSGACSVTADVTRAVS